MIKLFMLLTALGALKTLGATQKLIIEALLIALVVFFLVLLLHTMLQDHISTTFFAILFIIVLAGVVSVLTLSLTSWTERAHSQCCVRKSQEIDGELHATASSSNNNSEMD